MLSSTFQSGSFLVMCFPIWKALRRFWLWNVNMQTDARKFKQQMEAVFQLEWSTTELKAAQKKKFITCLNESRSFPPVVPSGGGETGRQAETSEGVTPDGELALDRFQSTKWTEGWGVSTVFFFSPTQTGWDLIASNLIKRICCISRGWKVVNNEALTSPVEQWTSTRASCPAGHTAAWRHWRWK